VIRQPEGEFITKMHALHGDLEAAVETAGVSGKAANQILAILHHASNRIPTYKGARLLGFLASLKTGEFLSLASRKRTFLENFAELLHWNRRSVSSICHLFFEVTCPQERTEAQLPEEMVKQLLMAGKMERNDRVKILVWDLLLKEGDQLARLVSPEDIAFALWLDEPLTRNKLIIFGVRHFGVEKAMQAFWAHASKNGRAIPSNISRQFMELVRAETRMKNRRDILSGIMEGSEFSYEEMDRLWSDHLSSQNRFELIRICLSDSDALSWMKGLKGDREQLAFNFKPAHRGLDAVAAFASRVYAIRAGKQGSAQIF